MNCSVLSALPELPWPSPRREALRTWHSTHRDAHVRLTHAVKQLLPCQVLREHRVGVHVEDVLAIRLHISVHLVQNLLLVTIAQVLHLGRHLLHAVVQF